MYKKRFIVDNDGCDIFQPPEKLDPSYEGFLEKRLKLLAGSGATTVCYTTQSSGFCVYTHKTKVGDLFINNVQYETNNTNIAPMLFEQGTDCLRYVERFCKENKLEFFWGMRMNDTHDAWIPAYFEQSHFKNAHPEYMLGVKGSRPPYGEWSAVNYSYPEIREMAWKSVEEVCENYDIDGVMLDFFRHPICFKNPSQGLHASAEEIACMTEVIGNIHDVVRKYAEKKGKSIDLAVRVPDCVEYARFLGLDVEDWLKRGYLDALVTTSYLQLNYWEYSVELGHKYGVPVYPSLDEPRLHWYDKEAHSRRDRQNSVRGRCANVKNSGADGVFFFNYIFDYPKQERVDTITHIQDEDMMKTCDLVFFADFRGLGHVAGNCPPHMPYRNIPLLNPENPATVHGQYNVDLYVGADLEDRRATLYIVTDGEGWEKLAVALNGTALDAVLEEGTVHANVPKEALRRGVNRVTLSGKGTAKDLYLTMA